MLRVRHSGAGGLIGAQERRLRPNRRSLCWVLLLDVGRVTGPLMTASYAAAAAAETSVSPP